MGINTPYAVMYGAGNIGRGFIGQIFHDSGYHVIFIDINRELVDALNAECKYKQIIVDDEQAGEVCIDNVSAIDGMDMEKAAEAIAGCEIMAVSVGAAILPKIAPVIAYGLDLRKKLGAPPLNILVCENLRGAPNVLRGLVGNYDAGFVATSIGRMVPVVPKSLRERYPTAIAVERFCELPVDADTFIGKPPVLAYTKLCSPFEFYEEKKLYIHNMGHALTAYFGYIKGYTYIYEAVADNEIHKKARGAMLESAAALHKKYGAAITELTAYVDDLLRRFGNKGLGDTIARVGQDPLRKLMPNDRLAGAVMLCESQGVYAGNIRAGIDACLKFDLQSDKSAPLLQQMLREQSKEQFLRNYCKLEEE